MSRFCLAALVLIGVVSSSPSAQEPGTAEAPAQEPSSDRTPPPGWSVGPTVGRLGDMATVNLPEGYMFLDAQATRRFLEEGQNIPDGDELGAIFKPMGEDDYWFAIFSYADTGHIDDAEKDSIDANALMKTLKEGNRVGNEERKKRGWTAVELEGWYQRPFYDPSTNNLTWSTEVSSEGSKAINHSVRLLGRTGTMSVQLVADSSSINGATGEFNDALRGYTYNAGKRYAEFRQGDKLAGYGLTALIAGGAGAAAVKTGVFQKLGKLIVLLFVGVAAALKKVFSALFGRRDKTVSDQYAESTGN